MTVKIHGTSCIFSKALIKVPKKLPIHKRMFNWFVDTTGLFKNKRIIDYIVEYGPIYSSRTVIKNRYINQNVDGGFYGADIWTEYGDIIYPYLEDGETLYGEIFGYLTNSPKYIQKLYDYGCKEGENKLMPYRVTRTDSEGKKEELTVLEVKEWTERLIDKMKANNDDNWKKIHVIDILYHGTLKDLYPELDTENHWHEELLEKMKYDKKNFGMEEYEPLCENLVPREGIVIRKDDSEIPEAWKLKCSSFLIKEAAFMEEVAEGKEELPEEMAEEYA